GATRAEQAGGQPRERALPAPLHARPDRARRARRKRVHPHEGEPGRQGPVQHLPLPGHGLPGRLHRPRSGGQTPPRPGRGALALDPAEHGRLQQAREDDRRAPTGPAEPPGPAGHADADHARRWARRGLPPGTNEPPKAPRSADGLALRAGHAPRGPSERRMAPSPAYAPAAATDASPRRRTRPGRAIVMFPPSTTTTPCTSTYGIPT